MEYKKIYNEAILADAIRVDGNFDEVYAAAMKSEEFRESTTSDGIKCDCCGETISPDEVAWHSYEENLDTCFDCEEEAGVSFSESKLLPNERIMEATIGERLSNIGRAIKDGLNKIFDIGMLGSFTVDQASEVAKKFWIHLKALQSGLDSLVDNLYYDAACCIRIGGYEIGDMFPSEAKILGGQTYVDDTYGRNPDWRLADLIKFELLSGGNSWAKELKWVDNAYNKGFDASKYSKKEFFAMFIARVEELAEKDLDNKLKKDTAKTQKKLDKENHISKKDRELTQMRKDFLGESFKQIYEGQTTFINHIGEKDSFDDPYNTGKSLAELDAEARMDDVPADSVEYWYKRLSKGLNFDTPEGLADAAWQWECEYTSDTAHDLAHDGGRLDAQRYSRALQMIYNKVVKGALNLGLTSKDTSGSLSQILADREKWQKNKDAAAKRKATMAANAKNRVQSYIEELRNADLPAEVRELFADDGYYKERRSYGVIKNYFDKPYGKALKAVWKDQFAN